jgi:hypothetical protein
MESRQPRCGFGCRPLLKSCAAAGSKAAGRGRQTKTPSRTFLYSSGGSAQRTIRRHGVAVFGGYRWNVSNDGRKCIPSGFSARQRFNRERQGPASHPPGSAEAEDSTGLPTATIGIKRVGCTGDRNVGTQSQQPGGRDEEPKVSKAIGLRRIFFWGGEGTCDEGCNGSLREEAQYGAVQDRTGQDRTGQDRTGQDWLRVQRE